MVLRLFKVFLRSPVFDTERKSLLDSRHKFKLHPADYPKIFYCTFIYIEYIFISLDYVRLQLSVNVYPRMLNFHLYLAVSFHLIHLFSKCHGFGERPDGLSFVNRPVY